MKPIILPLLVIFFFSLPVIAQEDQRIISYSPWELFPSSKLFRPLEANPLEPRVGLTKNLCKDEMRVEIGNSIDIIGYTMTSGYQVQAGIDFFAYAHTVGQNGLRLQIDAVDGFFGGHLTTTHLNTLSARLRILHRSAHLVDGGYSIDSNSWEKNRIPIPYTQDFGDFTLSYEQREKPVELRLYGGLAYATLVRPAEIKRISYHTGAESFFPSIIRPILLNRTNLFLAYHLALTGEPLYHATHSLKGGVKLGERNKNAVTVFLAYHNGTNMFGEFYNEHLDMIGAGFSVDF